MSDAIPLAARGYTDLPKGKIANVVTYLELTGRPAAKLAPSRPELALMRLGGRDVDRYLAMFRALGERWLWWSRLEMPAAKLAAMLDSPQVEALVLTYRGADAGLLELDFRALPAVELAFFGLLDSAIGRGMGLWMMGEAIERAFCRSAGRFFVHTCTFDHPNAVAFYRRCGFKAYKFAIELDDDPRLTGLLPRTAGPHVPLLEGN